MTSSYTVAAKDTLTTVECDTGTGVGHSVVITSVRESYTFDIKSNSKVL